MSEQHERPMNDAEYIATRLLEYERVKSKRLLAANERLRAENAAMRAVVEAVADMWLFEYSDWDDPDQRVMLYSRDGGRVERDVKYIRERASALVAQWQSEEAK